MLKHFFLGAVATITLAASGAANAAITITDLGQASGTGNQLLSPNLLVLGFDNAPVVSNGGTNDGSIIGTDSSNPFTDGTYGSVAHAVADGHYTDGSTGWNPFGVGSSNNWISIGGSGGYSVSGHSGASLYLGVNSPEYDLTFVWGSPSSTNTVTLISNEGTKIGSVSNTGNPGQLNILDSLGTTISTFDFAGMNSSSAGEIIRIASTNPFSQAVFRTGNGSGGFEVGGISAVPLPGAMPMFGAALLGLGLLSRRRKPVTA